MFAAKIFQIGSGVISAVSNGIVYTVDKSHHYYKELLDAFHHDDSQKFSELYFKPFNEQDVNNAILEKTCNENFVFTNDGLTYKGRLLHSVIIDRILEMKKAKVNFDFMINFLDNLYQNPSNRSITELYDFLEHQNLPITPDGCFLAYKAVRNDMLSKHTGSLNLISGKTTEDGRIDNSIGQIIECNRSEVDDERDNNCSHGLHVGGLKYSGPRGSYCRSGDLTVIVKVNPKDVVSVPRDHNALKIRVCKYEVISLYEEPLNSVASENDIVFTIDDIVNEKISFTYKDKTRYAYIEDSLEDNRILAVLLQEDPSYSEDDYYRTFKYEAMKNVNIIV